jgi:hypothetical protein
MDWRIDMSEWISVEDRLPDEKTFVPGTDVSHVIASDGVFVLGVLYRKEKGFGDMRCNELTNVTHWMPLPEPPK